MNKDFLGDAHDWMKGAVLHLLSGAGALEGFAVDPMITDEENWSEAEYKVYASLLHLSSDQVVSHSSTLRGNRLSYFKEIRHSGDIFLDPDIGILTGKGSPVSKYVKPREVVEITNQQPDRIVAVYQHIRGQTTRDRLAVVQKAFAGSAKELNAVVYGSASVALLFVSRDNDRLRKVYECLCNSLGTYRNKRVTMWGVEGDHRS